LWDDGSSHECVALRGVALDVRVGIGDEEREGTQALVVDVELYRHRDSAPVGGIEGCLNYDHIYRYVTEVWQHRPHTDLLEELAEDLIVFCLRDPRVEACRVVLRKPEIYQGQAIPTLEVYRRRRG
jgi:dihydroneopterin aldolase